MNEGIFRAYDIRGVYGQDITADIAEKIGKAFTTKIKALYNIKNPKLLVGRDNRTHGEELRTALVKGMISCGAEVSVLEDACSPMLYFGVCNVKFDGGVNVTASHNPAQDNGFKLIGREAHSIAGEDIQEIKQTILDESWTEEAGGTQQDFSVEEDYYQAIASKVELKKDMRVIVDAGNGIAGKYYPELLRRIGCEVMELYCEQDGSFPNHQPDPIVEANTEDLKKAVLEHKADLGISFDGDGDRCGIIDSQGRFHDADESFVLLIKEVLSKKPKSSVIYTVSNSLIVPQTIKELGGKAVMVSVGHSHVELAMHEHNAPLGGEQSGHFFVADKYYGFDDAGYASAYLINWMSRQQKSSAQLYDTLPKTYKIPEFRPHCDDDKKFQVVQSISDKLSAEYECSTMDGVRAELGNGAWIGVRASNTSPKISVCVEAKTEEELESAIKIANAYLKEEKIKNIDI